MTLAAEQVRRKRGRAPNEAAPPDPAALIAWYDRNRRRLPWRAQPGERSDPYRVWLSEIMLQQTTVTAVAPYYARFLARFPTLASLAAAPLEDVLAAWAGLGYYARARNLHACAKAVTERHGGRFPASEAALRALPGIGAYTTAAIAAIAFDRPAVPVDGNVERVVARLCAVEAPLPAAKGEIRRLAAALTPARRPGDFAQALMDLGATVCTPKRPACARCPFSGGCAARRRGDPEAFPRKVPKVEGRLRRGAAFVALSADGKVLLRTRRPHGLLAGMTEVPTTAWTHEFAERTAPAQAPALTPMPGKRTNDWRRVPGLVTHTFTHFPLELVVYAGKMSAEAARPAGTRWVSLADLSGEALPSVMRKVIAHALGGTMERHAIGDLDAIESPHRSSSRKRGSRPSLPLARASRKSGFPLARE